MDARLVLLKRVLEAAKEPLARNRLIDRLRLQKAVYLMQAAGVNLGYSYNWYLKGPYSTALTQDYFELEEQIDDPRQLSESTKQKIATVANVLKKPADVDLAVPHWYELLASIHYLKSKSKKTNLEARKLIEQAKPHLHGLFERGLDHLKQNNLI